MAHRKIFGVYAHPEDGGATGGEMPASKKNARLTAAAIEERIGALGLTIAELSRRSEVSEPVIRDLRQAVEKDYQTRSLSELSKALGWHHGHIAALLEGRQPEPAPEEETGQTPVVNLAAIEVQDRIDLALAALREASELLRQLRG